MRLAGTIADQHDAATVVDYLLTLGIGAKAEGSAGAWQIWVLDEDRVGEGKQALAEFASDPRNEKYRAAAREADRLRKAEVEKTLAARRNVIRLPGAAANSRGRRPLTMMLLTISAVVFAAAEFGDEVTQRHVVTRLMISGLVSLDGTPIGLPEVTQRGEYWRLMTPMFLHFTLLHFVFNMLWLVDFGTQIENRAGTAAMLGLVLACDLATNLAQFYWSGPAFGGMSGVNFGLFGYLWIKSEYEPWRGYRLPTSTIVLQVLWLFLCMAGVFKNVANAGHLGGLAAGAVIAYLPTLWRKLVGKS